MIRRGVIHTVRREDGARMALVNYQHDSGVHVFLEVRTPEGDVRVLGLAEVLGLVDRRRGA